MGYPFQGLTLSDLQSQVGAWTQKNFGIQEPWEPFLGIVEEIGELSHAHLKQLQGIRGSFDDHQKAKIDAVGDIVIFLANYCNVNNICFQEAVEKTWDKVSKRDWKSDSLAVITHMVDDD